MSHPTRGAWIEMVRKRGNKWHLVSHPTRGAWIEISPFIFVISPSCVAPHAGCVD